MTTSASFQATYLTPGAPNAIVGSERFHVAGQLYRLQEQLRGGATGPQAQARIDDRRKQKRLNDGSGKTPAGATMLTDFAAVDSL